MYIGAFTARGKHSLEILAVFSTATLPSVPETFHTRFPVSVKSLFDPREKFSRRFAVREGRRSELSSGREKKISGTQGTATYKLLTPMDLTRLGRDLSISCHL